MVNAKITWKSPVEGGRKNLPGQNSRYCPIIKFNGENSSVGNWSADITILKTDYDSLYSLAELKYLSPNAPNCNIYTGNKFMLYEGNRLVALGEVL